MGRKLLAGFCLLTAFLLLLGTRGAMNAARPKVTQGLGELPDFAMMAITADSQTPLEKKTLLGRPWIANFIFTRCSGPCSLLTLDMAKLQAALPKDIRLISFTVDPERDDPKTLQRYAKWHGADPTRWCFVTADKQGLYKLIYEGFKLPLAEDRNAPADARVTHSAKFVLVDKQGVVRGYYGRNGWPSLETLKKDALKLLQETS